MLVFGPAVVLLARSCAGLLLVLTLLVALGACGRDEGDSTAGYQSSGTSGQTGDGSGERGSSDAAELTVMSFNVWYGGIAVDDSQVPAAIREAGADIVGLQEPEGNLRKIAAETGLPYVDDSLHIISRYPLFAVDRDGIRLAYVALDPGHVVAITNVHLTSTPYGPRYVSDGKSVEQVIELERGLRLPEIKPYLDPLSELSDAGTPVFVTGDMNAPSHLDWTEETTESREQVKFPVAWPVSKALADAGFQDSYREAHPDPVADPGITWTPGTPPPIVREGELLDRIDFVMESGPARTVDSRLVGEEGGPDVEVGVSPWPSDHRAVASTFEVEPAPTPALVSAEPRAVERGERLIVRFAQSDRKNGRMVGLLPSGSDDEPLQTLPIYKGYDHLTAMFGTTELEPGKYRAALLNADGSIAATSPFWVQDENAVPQVEVADSSLAPDEPVKVSWSNAPGNKLDWIGIFKAGDPDLYNYFGFLYAGARPEGEITFGGGDLGGELQPGSYEAKLLMDDGYAVLASAPFEVTGRTR